MRDFIITDENRIELGFLPDGVDVDMDVGDDNDFQLVIPLELYSEDIYKIGGYFYCPHTEYGGRFDNFKVSTKSQTVTLTGKTFRGFLDTQIVIPFGSTTSWQNLTDYVTVVNMDINEAILEYIILDYNGNNRFGEDLYVVDDTPAGVVITNYNLPRFETCLDCINALCNTVDMRLKIECIPTEEGFIVQLSAVPIEDYSNLEEFSQDTNLDFTIEKHSFPYTHMIVLGSGDLADRNVAFLAMQNGRPTAIQYFPTGRTDLKVVTYEANSVADHSELVRQGQEKWRKDLIDNDEQTITFKDEVELNLEVGDIVGGRDYVTGTYISEAITKKIIKYKNGKQSITYTIGGK